MKVCRLLLLALGLAGTLLPVTPVTAQVFKCIGPSGGVTFSNTPCPVNATGGQIDVRPNSLDTSGSREQTKKAQSRQIDEQLRAQEAARDAAAAPSGSASSNVCPTENEIRNMERSASSSGLTSSERNFFAEEARRARQCRKGQGNYTADDWRVSREALNAQGSLDPQRAAQERARAEAMHSAADPVEGDRIAQQKAAALARSAAIFNCSANVCTNAAGETYNRSGNSNTYVGPRGACTRAGNQLICP